MKITSKPKTLKVRAYGTVWEPYRLSLREPDATENEMMVALEARSLGCGSALSRSSLNSFWW